MKTIWKYELEIGDNDILMPAALEPLCIQMQHGVPVMWVLVNPKIEFKAWYHFKVYGTGHPMPDEPGKYVGTFQYISGLVFHVFMEDGCDPQ